MTQPTMGNSQNKDTYLTGLAISYFQDAKKAIADKAIPQYPVELETGKYNILNKEYILRTDFEARADGANFKETEFKLSEATYNCTEFSEIQWIGDRTAQNARINLKAVRTRLMTEQAVLFKNRYFVNTFLKTSLWGTDVQGVASGATGNQVIKWNLTTSDPIKDINKYKLAMEGATGFLPNKMIIARDVMNALVDNPKILDRMAVTGTRIATVDFIRQLFDLDELFVSGMVQNSANPQQAAAIDFLTKGKALLYYSPETADLWTPTAFMSFVPYTSDENLNGIHVFSGRDELRRSDYVQMSMFFDMKVICADLGVYLYDLV